MHNTPHVLTYLNINLQDVGGEEPQGNVALPWELEQLHSVNNLHKKESTYGDKQLDKQRMHLSLRRDAVRQTMKGSFPATAYAALPALTFSGGMYRFRARKSLFRPWPTHRQPLSAKHRILQYTSCTHATPGT